MEPLIAMPISQCLLSKISLIDQTIFWFIFLFRQFFKSLGKIYSGFFRFFHTINMEKQRNGVNV